MREISPTNSDLKLQVDDDVFDQLNTYKWRIRPSGYAEVDRKTKLYKTYKTRRLHRIIFMMTNGLINAGWEVDHIDRNPLNNQLSNLRKCIRKNNALNTGPHKDGTSIYKGVHWDQRKKRWYSNISVNGKKIHLGVFDCEKTAATKYNEAVLEYIGDWGMLNNV